MFDQPEGAHNRGQDTRGVRCLLARFLADPVIACKVCRVVQSRSPVCCRVDVDSLIDWTADSGARTVPALRAVLTDYRLITPFTAPASSAPEIGELERAVAATWDAYQASRFGQVAGRLPMLIADAVASSESHTGDERRRAYELLALTYQVATIQLTKFGEPTSPGSPPIEDWQQPATPTTPPSSERCFAPSLHRASIIRGSADSASAPDESAAVPGRAKTTRSCHALSRSCRSRPISTVSSYSPCGDVA